MEVEVEIVEAVNPVFEAAEEAVVVVVIIDMIEKAVNPMFEVVALVMAKWLNVAEVEAVLQAWPNLLLPFIRKQLDGRLKLNTGKI